MEQGISINTPFYGGNLAIPTATTTRCSMTRAAGHGEYADLERGLRSALAWAEAAYHESRRLKG